MGAPFEGDVCGKGLASEMPDWVKKQIEMDDYVGYLKAPVGTWDGKTYRISIDGDCHNFNYRTDVFSDADLAEAWKAGGGQGEWGVPKTWQQVQAVTKFLKGKQVDGQDAFGYLDAPKAWGGFGFYFLGSRATAYAKHPDDKAWLFDADTMKPRVNNPAWVRAIQDVIDALPSEPPTRSTPTRTRPPSRSSSAAPARWCSWWGDVGSNVKTNDTSVVGDVTGFSILPGSDDVYNTKTGAWDKLASGPNYAPNMAYIGWGVYVMATRRQRREEAEGGLELRGASRRQGHLALDGGLSVRLPALSQQPLQHSGVGGGRLRRGVHQRLSRSRTATPTTTRTPRSSRASPASSSTNRSPRTSWRRSSPASRTPRPAPTTSPPPGRRSPTRSAATTRSSSTRPRWACKVFRNFAAALSRAPPILA